MTSASPSLRPETTAERFARAVAHQEAGRFEAALADLEHVLVLTPDHPEAHTRRGWILARLGRLAEGIAAHEAAIRAAPAFASAWSNLGVALQAAGRHDEALQALQRGVALDGNLAQAHVNLGLAWQVRGALSEAARCHRRALALDPRLPEAWVNLGLALQEAGDAQPARVATEHARALDPHHRAALSNRLMQAQYDEALSLPQLRELARESAAHLPAERTLPARAVASRVRVGYVSADLWSHPVGFLASRALLAHDRERFEVHVFSDVGHPDALTAALRAGLEHWHDVRALDDEALRERILECGIDVLVDLAGHTAGNRMGVFAMRAAPVQLSWLGYFASTGLATMDGVLLGEGLVAPGVQEGFTEPVRTLRACPFTYTPPSYAPPPTMRETSRPVVLGSFNNPAKLGMAVIATWAKVLAALPDSRLVLKSATLGDAEAAARLLRRFATLGVDPARIEIRGASPHPQMLAEYGDIDIALDPFPFCGGLTTCEALWMGVPVVTLPWIRPLSRQGLAVLSAIGLEELVASTPGDYVRIVCTLAADGARRSALRTELRERISRSALFDGRALAAALEAEYVR